MADPTELLSHSQILQKIDRIAFQIIEDNLNEKEVYIIGIANTGFVFAQY